MNRNIYLYQVNWAFREAYFGSPVYCDPKDINVSDDFYMYLMM